MYEENVRENLDSEGETVYLSETSPVPIRTAYICFCQIPHVVF